MYQKSEEFDKVNATIQKAIKATSGTTGASQDTAATSKSGVFFSSQNPIRNSLRRLSGVLKFNVVATGSRAGDRSNSNPSSPN